MTERTKAENEKEFIERLHRQGRIWCSACILLMLAAPVAIGLRLNAWPSIGGVAKGVFSVCIIYIPVCIVEVITYSPLLGTGASYLAFITGNLSNLKIPCAMNAHEIVGVEFGTVENEIVSTLSVAVSSLVTCAVLALGVMLIAPLGPLLSSKFLQPAFNTILPALFGAMGFTYFSKAPKAAIAPAAFMTALCLIIPAAGGQVGFLIPLGAAIAIIWTRFLYVRKKLGSVG
ncbi:MAG: hypothetical protein LBU32_05130 [Clostridiales bacterium]|jgi:hypothetical protein|nr:hypothetical protein [Clostridiales bacterium]